MESLNPCVVSGIWFCIVGMRGHTESLEPESSKAKWIICFLRLLFEADDMGKTKIKISVVGIEKRQLKDEISTQLTHLISCFYVTF